MSIINRRQRLEDGFHRFGVNSILWFLDQVNAANVGQVSGQSEGQHPQGSIGRHPRRNLQAAFVTQHQVSVLVVFALNDADIFQISQRGLQVPNPFAKTVFIGGSQMIDDPRLIRAIRSEFSPLPGRACSSEQRAVQKYWLHTLYEQLSKPVGNGKR